MAQRREHPYICTTWLPKLLTGENSCECAVWFKAHHQDWTRTPSKFSQAEWMLNRTSLLNEQKTQWEARGQDVYVEGQNSFRLRGQSATLAGRPDLIVVRNDDALIIDIKAGQKQPSHYVQIMIYMYALPRALPQYQHAKLAGEVVYPTRTARVPMGGLHTQFIKDLGSLIRRLAADEPAARVPSEHECRFCDISALDCPERMDEGSQPERRVHTKSEHASQRTDRQVIRHVQRSVPTLLPATLLRVLDTVHDVAQRVAKPTVQSRSCQN